LRRELEQLLQETNALLACPNFEPAAWEPYTVRRAALFARLQSLTLPTEEKELAAVMALVHELLAQDALLMQKAQIRLATIGAELASLAASRRVLKGYACLSSPASFQTAV
jgi:hypothetical protein